MTVGELIGKLRSFNPSLPVVTPGFDESGINLVTQVQEIQIVERIGPRGTYQSQYLEPEDSRAQPNQPATPAVYLNW
jgi:hypothetical protein